MIVAQEYDVQEHIDQLKRLDLFIGKWKIEGKNFPVPPNNVETAVHGEDHCEWLEGDFFIVNRWQHLAEGAAHKGISIFGYDPDDYVYFSKNFDNLGFERRYILTPDDQQWNFTGAKERASRIFSDDGHSYVEEWEALVDDEWLPLCTMNGTRID